jgi:hypothetical protein
MMIKANQAGQSTIEFIFTFAFGVSIIFMVFNSALNYCTGYLVHYATFMASRTYLTHDYHMGTPAGPDESMQGAQEAAVNTYAKYMLDAFGVGVDKFSVNEDSGNGAAYLTVGAKTVFEKRIDAIGQVTGETTLELVSESFLGHEPTRAHCASRTCYAITGGTQCSNELDITLYDNGC